MLKKIAEADKITETDKKDKLVRHTIKSMGGVLSNNKYVFLILLLALSFIIVGHALRLESEKNVVAGEGDYYHIHLTNLLYRHHAIKNILVVDNRPVYFTPYHHLSAYLGRWLSPMTFFPLFSGVVGIVAILLFHILLRRWGMSQKESAITLILLTITPAFLTLLLGNVNSLAIVCILSGFLLITTKAKGLKRALLAGSGVAFLSISSLFSISHAILILLGLSILFFSQRKLDNEQQQRGMVLALATILILLLMILFKPPFVPEPGFQEYNPFINQLSDFGEETGFSIFLWILVIIGVISTWKNKKEWNSIYLISALFILASFIISKEMNSYLVFLFSILAMRGVLRLHRSVWEVEWLQRATIVIIICGLLFSSVSFLNTVRTSPPSNRLVEGLQIINELTDPDGVILSHPDNGYYIEALAERKVLLDNYHKSIAGIDEKKDDIQHLFQTRELHEAKELLQKYNIDYLVITRDMKEGKVWTGKNQGLLFLLRSNETFKNIYNNGEIEVWKVLNNFQ